MLARLLGHDIRVAVYDNKEVWWVVKDLCEIPGFPPYEEAVACLNEDDKELVVDSASNDLLVATREFGLYALLLEADSPAIEDFQHWLVKNLVRIVKTGKCVLRGKMPAVMREINYAYENAGNPFCAPPGVASV